MQRVQRVYAIALLWMAVVFVGDRLTKIGASSADALPVGLIPTFLTFVQHHNEGLIANIPVPMPWIIVISLVALAFIGRLWWRAMQANDLRGVVAFGLIIGGALGNLYDRLLYGYVIDWILLFGRSAMNLADAAILMGIILVLWRTKESSRSSAQAV
ncbi:MAG: lipoprotein signal peptidase [Candidatus Parcubacteria bacterium]|jgi:signal peptidase II